MVKFEGTKFPAGGREQVARAANAVGSRCFVWIWITVSVSAKTPLRRKYVVFERYFVEVSDVRNISTVSRTTLGRLMTTFGVACV